MTLTTTEGIASLITRLRKEESNCASVYIIDAAIETIEILVKERDQLLKQRFVVDEVEENARRRVETAFRSERDEARREVCEIAMPCVGSQRGYAKGRGWDCYTT
jgi:hypothetical protein